MKLVYLAVTLAAASSACLEPPEDDEIPLETFFGDPAIAPEDAPHVEDVPALAANVQRFATDVAYLRGYADGEEVRYWNVDGDNATFIAPLYHIIGTDGQQIGRTIIDVIPGDTGYTPWWRIVEVYVTDRYDGERIWSRAAIDAGIRAGILQEPLPTQRVVNCPVILREAKIPVSLDSADDVTPEWVWYRDKRVDWVVFSDFVDVDLDVREMPIYPVYVLQRIDEAAPIYEFVTGVDVNGDQRLDDSNNIFASGLDGPRYSPLWYVAFVRVEADYLSIDTSTGAAVGLSAESQFYDPIGNRVLSSLVVPPVLEMKQVLVNCPIQRTEGRL